MTTTASVPSMRERALRPAAFIDRDGVINEERNYVYRPNDFVLLPGVGAALRRLRDAGFLLVVVTNQAGIGRGKYTEADFHALTEHMRAVLRADGVELDGVYFCPHHPSAGLGGYRVDCDCRKPEPGMLLQAQRDLGIDMAQSVLVGDKMSDIAAGQAAGVKAAVLVRSGHALDDEALPDDVPVFADLLDAAGHLSSLRRSTEVALPPA